MNVEYFKHCESEDYEKLLSFNEKVGLFRELIPISGCLHYDASGVTIDGRTARIELKTRNMPYNRYETAFIEDHKTANLLFDFITLHDLPIYLCFYDDGILVFNLARLTKRPEQITGRSKTNGYGGYEYNSRNSLYTVDAAIYDNNAKLIQSPRWKQQKNS